MSDTRATRSAEQLSFDLNCSAVLDGEIVRLDAEARPQFYDLLRRRGEPVFYAFDVFLT